MSDDTLQPDDELVNAVLDGEATAGERDRVLGDPALRDRLEKLRAVARAVADPVAVSAVDRDRLIANAVAAGTAGEAAAKRAAVVTPLHRRRSMGPALAAAAVVLALLGVAAVLARSEQSSDTATRKFESVGNAVTALGDEPAPAAGGGPAARGGGEAGVEQDAGGPVTTTAPALAPEALAGSAAEPAALTALGDLGDVADTAGVRAALAPLVDDLRAQGSDLAPSDVTSTTGAPGNHTPATVDVPEACRAAVAGAWPDEPVVAFAAGPIRYGGQPALVLVGREVQTDEVRVVVLTAPGCTVVDRFTI